MTILFKSHNNYYVQIKVKVCFALLCPKYWWFVVSISLDASKHQILSSLFGHQWLK